VRPHPLAAAATGEVHSPELSQKQKQGRQARSRVTGSERRHQRWPWPGRYRHRAAHGPPHPLSSSSTGRFASCGRHRGCGVDRTAWTMDRWRPAWRPYPPRPRPSPSRLPGRTPTATATHDLERGTSKILADLEANERDPFAQHEPRCESAPKASSCSHLLARIWPGTGTVDGFNRQWSSADQTARHRPISSGIRWPAEPSLRPPVRYP
jgi:hypothetical protein